MRRVTIYDGPANSEIVYTEGDIELGGLRKVRSIRETTGVRVLITFSDGSYKVFNGFRFIIDDIHEGKKRK